MKNVNSTQQYTIKEKKKKETSRRLIYIHTRTFIIISIIILLLHIIALYIYRAALFSFDLFGQRLCTLSLYIVGHQQRKKSEKYQMTTTTTRSFSVSQTYCAIYYLYI